MNWPELLRKYLKHNSGKSEAELVVAETQLELAVWQAVERRERNRSYGSTLRRRQNRALKTHVDAKGKAPAVDQREEASDEWVVKNREDSQAIREALRKLEDAIERQRTDQTYTVSTLIQTGNRS